MTRSSVIKPLTLLPFIFLSVAATNFTQCLIDFQAGDAISGGVDSKGVHVSNPEDAVGLTYETCTTLCGTGPELFEWSVFSQQFSSWLLPWLALVSQLPFGAGNRLDNLISGEFHSISIHRRILPLPHHHTYSSPPHRRVPNSCSIFARSHGPQHSLGLQPFLGHQLPQSQ